MEKDEVLNIVFRVVAVSIVIGLLISILVMAINFSPDLKTYLSEKHNMFFLNARWGIFSIITVFLIVCYFIYDIISTINNHRVGKKLLKTYMENLHKKQLRPFDIHQKNTANEPPCFIVLFEDKTSLILNKVPSGEIDKKLEKRYRFFDSYVYLLAVDKIYPDKIYLFG